MHQHRLESDPHARRFGIHHQARTLDSQAEAFKQVTCDAARLSDAARAPADIARVLASARRESRPVLIELPRDMAKVPCGPVPPPEAAAPAAAVDAASVAAAAAEVLRRLSSSRDPILLAGVELARLHLEARAAALAAALGLPVVNTFVAHGVLDRTDAPVLGTYMGAATVPGLAARVEASDCLLLLGALVTGQAAAAALMIDLYQTDLTSSSIF